MASNNEFISKSLETHLFFARIMKEHALFLQLSFTPKDEEYRKQADMFRREFDKLLMETVSLVKGVIRQDVLRSGEMITQFTLNAELATSYFTGVSIPTEITQAEISLLGDDMNGNAVSEEEVNALNRKAYELTTALIQFKNNLLNNLMSCNMFSKGYPLMVQHDLHEAQHYLSMIQELQSEKKSNHHSKLVEHEMFWNEIMAEHAKFIRGLLDPTEKDFINIANNFGNAFDKLSKEAKIVAEMRAPLEKLTHDSINATILLRNFKFQGTKGILECKIKSMIIPLLSDHVLREANHYLRELNTSEMM